MYIEELSLSQFRNYEQASLKLAPSGVTLFVGPNGSGKSNLLEAVAYLATLKSFRGAPAAVMVRVGQPRAVLAARVRRENRIVDVSAEITLSGSGRLTVNRQPVRRSADFAGLLHVIVFCPDDLEIVKAGPSVRREFLDALLVEVSPPSASLLASFDRALRQRNALLRSASGVMSGGMRRVLEAWDAQVAETGEALARARRQLVDALAPRAREAYGGLGGTEAAELAYDKTWASPLLESLQSCLAEDLRLGVTTAGPHRDDLHLLLGGMPARVQASQGQQRTLALALRLAAYDLVAASCGSAPVMVLDDVFSELDGQRAAALAASLPESQVLVATAGPAPPGLRAVACVEVRAGTAQEKELEREGRGDP